MTIRDIAVANAAGFFDGEGSVMISRSTWRGVPEHHLAMSASQLTENVAPLFQLKMLFGGVVRSKPTKEKGRRPLSQWELHGKKAHAALCEMFPYLHVKRKPAFMGIAFHCGKDEFRAQRRPHGRLTDLEITFGDACHLITRYCNGKRLQGMAPTQVGSAG